MPARIDIARGDQTLAWTVSDGAESEGGFGISTRLRHSMEQLRRIPRLPTSSSGQHLVCRREDGKPRLRQWKCSRLEQRPSWWNSRCWTRRFFNSFHSAVEAETLLMTDVDVTWQRSQLPA